MKTMINTNVIHLIKTGIKYCNIKLAYEPADLTVHPPPPE